MKKLLLVPMFLIAFLLVIAQVDSVGNDPVISTTNPFLAIGIAWVGMWLTSAVISIAVLGQWWKDNKANILASLGGVVISLIYLAIDSLGTYSDIVGAAIIWGAGWLSAFIAAMVGFQTLKVTAEKWWGANRAEIWFTGGAIVLLIWQNFFGVGQ